MDSKDASPFGYTFEGDFAGFGGGEPTAFANGGPPLLSENENQSLIDFFSQDPFLSQPTTFPSHTETKNAVEEFNWDMVPPANVHQVSATIPDQSQLQRGFHADSFSLDPLASSHLTSTQDDLQAASTLFNNAQASHASHANGRSYSVPNVHTMLGLPPATTLTSSAFHDSIPLVATPHGLMNEQLAALLPNHSENGSIDEQIAAQFSQIQRHSIADMNRSRSHLKRAYTYGTDSAFNASGYAAPTPNVEATITQRLIHDLHTAQGLTRVPPPSADRRLSSPTDQIPFPVGLVELPSDGEARSEEETSDDGDGDKPARKRQKSKHIPARADKTPTTQRKSFSAGRPGKNRKTSVDEQAGKKKRLSSAGQKAQRENLTEEQKRNNHILSEQKRRNLIKRGFDDLHDLVPEIRNGGLSKSSVLMEAANFLEKIVQDNIRYRSLVSAADG